VYCLKLAINDAAQERHVASGMLHTENFWGLEPDTPEFLEFTDIIEVNHT